jgi:hypothetical protein
MRMSFSKLLSHLSFLISSSMIHIDITSSILYTRRTVDTGRRLLIGRLNAIIVESSWGTIQAVGLFRGIFSVPRPDSV